MSLIIKQGKQDTSKDKAFDVIKDKNVFGVISEVKPHDKFDGALSIVIDILDNKYKGRKVWDDVTYDPTSEYSWKYRKLRDGVGKPYNETEEAEIDIEKVLLNQKVKMNLDGRMGNDGNEYQKITYLKKPTKETTTAAPAKAEPAEPTAIEQDSEWD